VRKTIELEEKEVEYTLAVSARARQMRLAIYHDGRFVVTMPRWFSEKRVEQFILKKSEWILKTIARFKAEPKGLVIAGKRGDFARHKEAAQKLAVERLSHFNTFYNFKYHSVSVRNQKTRWGSCSKSGNLSFNYKIALLPSDLADYIVVHELCHLGEFSHSKKFWALVGRTVPDYQERKRELRKVRFV